MLVCRGGAEREEESGEAQCCCARGQPASRGKLPELKRLGYFGVAWIQETATCVFNIPEGFAIMICLPHIMLHQLHFLKKLL